MKHTFNLVYPGRATSPVRLIVSHDGEKFRRSIGVTVDTKLWNAKAKSLDKKCRDRNAWAVIGPIHAKLVEKELSARKRRDVLDAIGYALGEDLRPVSVHLWDYFKEWAEAESPSRRFRLLAYDRLTDIMGTGTIGPTLTGIGITDSCKGPMPSATPPTTSPPS